MNNKKISTYFSIVSFILFFNSNCICQCPTYISLEGQIQVDDFPTNYPDCVTQGWVTNIDLRDGYDLDPIIDLSPLASIISVRDELFIDDCSISDFTTWSTLDSIHRLNPRLGNNNLLTLSGLEGLTYLNSFTTYSPIQNIDAIGHLPIKGLFLSNTDITEISGFNSAIEVDNIYLSQNSLLETISGFQNVESVNTFITIEKNPLIDDLSGFGNLEIVGSQLRVSDTKLTDLSDFNSLLAVNDWIRIKNNTLLTDISQLSQLLYGNGIEVSNNILLDDCCVARSLNQQSVINQTTILNNNTNCKNIVSVINFCLDSDSDGFLDNEDNCPNASNVTQSDYDNDLVGDGCDNCPLVSNPSQADSDGNGIGDACDTGIEEIGVWNNLGDMYNFSNTKGIVLKSIDNNCYRIIVNSQGGIETHLIECP